MEPMEHWHPQYFRLEAEDMPPETMRLLAFSMGFAAHSPLCALRGMWQGQQPESLEITLPSGPWQALEAKSNVPLEGGRFQAALTRAAFARLSRLSERSPLYAGGKPGRAGGGPPVPRGYGGLDLSPAPGGPGP